MLINVNIKDSKMKTLVVGIDVSKEALDVVLSREGEALSHSQFPNKEGSFKIWMKETLQAHGGEYGDWLICMENTGIYCHHVMEVCVVLGLDLWVEDAGRIKAFHSLSRGKNDALDAARIARYGYLKQSEAVLWQPPRKELVKLKSLVQLRKRLLTTKQRLSSPLGEEEFMGCEWSREHKEHIQPILVRIAREIKDVEEKMRRLISGDESLQQQYVQVSSVKGVRLIVAATLLVMTNEFKSIRDPRKLACQAGVAPFPYESGKSIRGRSKVSHRAHKPLKVLLNLAARSSVSSQGELRDYYERKVAEGKNKMVVLKAIRNKIIHRVYACVRDGREYEENYRPALV